MPNTTQKRGQEERGGGVGQSHKPMSVATTKTPSEYLDLYRIIEQHPLNLPDIEFKELALRFPGKFGEPNTEEQKKFSNHFGWLKKKSAEKWVKFLCRPDINISPAEKTKKWLADSQGAATVIAQPTITAADVKTEPAAETKPAATTIKAADLAQPVPPVSATIPITPVSAFFANH